MPQEIIGIVFFFFFCWSKKIETNKFHSTVKHHLNKILIGQEFLLVVCCTSNKINSFNVKKKAILKIEKNSLAQCISNTILFSLYRITNMRYKNNSTSSNSNSSTKKKLFEKLILLLSIQMAIAINICLNLRIVSRINNTPLTQNTLQILPFS